MIDLIATKISSTSQQSILHNSASVTELNMPTYYTYYTQKQGTTGQIYVIFYFSS